jgi:hypothetical protein
VRNWCAPQLPPSLRNLHLSAIRYDVVAPSPCGQNALGRGGDEGEYGKADSEEGACTLATLLDTNTNASLGSSGTHIDTALSSVNTLITIVGNGSAWNNTLPYVFLVTDGAQDPQVKGVPNGSWSGSNHARTIDPATSCMPLKNRGIIISVLYIPYQPINRSTRRSPATRTITPTGTLRTSRQACKASPGFFYTANTPADIPAALNAIQSRRGGGAYRARFALSGASRMPMQAQAATASK